MGAALHNEGLALILLAGAAGGSCRHFTQSCTEIGCVEGPAIVVHSERWPDGSYLIGLSTTETEVECSFEQGGALGYVVGPDRPRGTTTTGGQPPGPLPRCVVISGPSSVNAEILLEDAARVTLLGATPDTVTVVVHFDGEEVHREQLRPTYTRVFPNGRECDDGCAQATEEVSVAAL